MPTLIEIFSNPTVVITVVKLPNGEQYEVHGQVGVDPLDSYDYITTESENKYALENETNNSANLALQKDRSDKLVLLRAEVKAQIDAMP